MGYLFQSFYFLSVIFINILAVTSIPNRQIWSKQFFCFLTWLGVIFSLTLAILITNFNEPLFRIMIPLMVFISFFVFFFIYKIVRLSVFNYFKISNIFLTLLLGVIGYYSMSNWYSSINSSHMELEYLKNKLSKWNGNQIIVIKNVDRARSTRSFLNKKPIGDEFNVNTTVYSAEEIGFIIKLILNKGLETQKIMLCSLRCLNEKKKLNNGFIFYSKQSSNFKGNKDHFVIDMLPFTVKNMSDLAPYKLDDFGFPKICLLLIFTIMKNYPIKMFYRL